MRKPDGMVNYSDGFHSLRINSPGFIVWFFSVTMIENSHSMCDHLRISKLWTTLALFAITSILQTCKKREIMFYKSGEILLSSCRAICVPECIQGKTFKETPYCSELHKCACWKGTFSYVALRMAFINLTAIAPKWWLKQAEIPQHQKIFFLCTFNIFFL